MKCIKSKFITLNNRPFILFREGKSYEVNIDKETGIHTFNTFERRLNIRGNTVSYSRPYLEKYFKFKFKYGK